MKKKHNLRIKGAIWLSLTLLGLSLQGCFIFRETLSLSGKDTGHLKLEVDMTLFRMFEEARQPLPEIEGPLKELEQEIARLSGIRQVESGFDPAAFLVWLEFDFKSLGALNEALSKVYAQAPGEIPPVYRLTDRGLQRRQGPLAALPMDRFLPDTLSPKVFENMVYELRMDFRSSVQVAYTEAQAAIQGDKNREFSASADMATLKARPEVLDLELVLD